MAGPGRFLSEFLANCEFRADSGQIASEFRANSEQAASIPTPLFPCHSCAKLGTSLTHIV